MSFFGRLFATAVSVGNHVCAQVIAGADAPFERLAWLKHDAARLEALAVASRALSFDERYTAAGFVLDHAATITPLGLIERRIDLAHMQQKPEAELVLVQQAAIAFPKDTHWRARLADLYIEFDKLAEALAVLDAGEQDRILDTTRARVLAEMGEYAEARRLAHELAIYWEELTRGSLMEGASMEAALYHGRCLDVLDRVTELEQGPAARVLATAARGELDRHAHQNYTLIGVALIDEGVGGSPAPLTLPDEQGVEDAIRSAPKDVDALCGAGMLALREGAMGRARGYFDTAHQLDVKHFPAALGLGATMRMEGNGAWRALDLLPAATELPGLDTLVPEWPALTQEERRVVHAALWPLRSTVPAMVAGGARLRILSLRGRVEDLSEDGPIGIARIEDLLDTTDAVAAWQVAYELGQLAAPHLPAHIGGELTALHHRATQATFAVGSWEQGDVATLFAAALQGWLQRRYASKWAPERDPEGIVLAVEALISRLADVDGE